MYLAGPLTELKHLFVLSNHCSLHAPNIHDTNTAQSLAGHRTRSIDDDTMIALSPTTQELLMYESCPAQAAFEVDVKLLHEHTDVEFHYDLMDCHIDVCSPEV
jgi:translation initiation factor eIF-2B subunit epsilon